MKKWSFKFCMEMSLCYGFAGALYLYVLIRDNSEITMFTRIIISLVIYFSFTFSGAMIAITYHKEIPKKQESEGFFT